MISLLTGYKKKLVKETISYFIDTTGLTSDNFILLVQRNNMKDEDTLGYNEWLAVKCFKMLKGHGISLADCLEFRNLAVQLKMEKRGINISPIWKKEIAKCIEETDISENYYNVSGTFVHQKEIFISRLQTFMLLLRIMILVRI